MFPITSGTCTIRAVSAATMADWALQQVTVPKRAAILDVGCGGGSTVRRLAALASEGKVIGLDCSAASVAVSRDTNAKEIEAGRPNRAGFGGRFAVPRSHVRHCHGCRDALLLARPASQRARDPESTQTRWDFRLDCRNVPRRAVPSTLRHSYAAAPRRIPERRRTPGPLDRGRIRRARRHALCRLLL